jgi:hypothetical protein
MGTGSLYPQHVYVGYVTKDERNITYYAMGKPRKTRGYVLNVADYKSSDPICCRGQWSGRKLH